MRKLTKVLVLAAAFTALFALTALAKTGWASDENGWYYVGTDGDRVTEVTKNSNGKVYYLGEDGYMVKNQAVTITDGDTDKLYYFGEDGARVANQWVLLPAKDDDESGETERWYRFGKNGIAVKGTETNPVQKVGDYYYGFDLEGRMLFGFVDAEGNMINDAEDPICECKWYFGDSDDGVMKTGWIEYEGFSKEEWESGWFYFKPKTGVKYANGNYLIEKKTYVFNAKGKMLTGWAYTATPDETEDRTDKKVFWNADGTKKSSGWVYAARLDGTDASAWYYLGSGSASKAGAVTGIKSKYYAFNFKESDPYMLSGLVYLKGTDVRSAVVATASDAKGNDILKPVATKRSDLIAHKVNNEWVIPSTDLFYFSKNENAGGGVDGWALSGAVEYDFDDELVTLNFDKHTYKLVHGKVGDYLYNYGRLQTADGYGLKKVWVGFDADEAPKFETYLVDSKGKVITKYGKYKDADGNYYVQNGVDKYFFVANDEYEYTVFNKDGSVKETKYANAATVAEKLYKGTWDVEKDEIQKKSKEFKADFVEKVNAASSN